MKNDEKEKDKDKKDTLPKNITIQGEEIGDVKHVKICPNGHVTIKSGW